MDHQIFQDLLYTAGIALIGIVALLLRNGVTLGMAYLQSKMSASNFDLMKSFAMTTVSYLEQSPAFKDLTGSDKKERAITEIVTWCGSHNLPVDGPMIDKLIEEAIHELNIFTTPNLS